MTINKREAPVVYVSLVRKGGKSIPLDLSKDVLDMTYTDSDSKADKVEFTVDNSNLRNFDRPLWKKGAILEVSWGYAGNTCPPHEVVVESVKGWSKLKVEAHSKGVLMNKKKKSRKFSKITRSGVVRAIAAEYGFADENIFVTDTPKLYPQITQGAQTDAQFVQKLADKEGFVFYLDVDGFHWHERQFAKKPMHSFVWNTGYSAHGITDQFVIGEPDIENDITRKRPKAVKKKGVDAKTGEIFEVQGSNVDTERTGLAPQLDTIQNVSSQPIDMSVMATLMIEGEPGPESAIPEGSDDQILEVIDGETKTTRDTLDLFEDGYDATDQGNTTSRDAEEAKVEADKEYREAQEVAVKLSFRALGDPTFGAKRVFHFGCASPRVTGLYYAKEVVHTISNGNYVMTIKSITDGQSTSAGVKSKEGSDAKVNAADNPGADGEGDQAEQLEPLESIDGETKDTATIWVPR